MLFQAQRELHLDLSRTLFIGDDERDAQAADGGGMSVGAGISRANLCSTLHAR